MRPLMFGLTALALASCPAAASAGTLTVSVSNVRSDRGVVHVDICPAADFLSDRCVRAAQAPARTGTTTITVADLSPGRYAAQAFHDENANGKVDRALFGIPKEGVGFSNDAPIRLAAPTFGAAAFDYRGGAQTIRFRLRYFLGRSGPAR